MSLFFDDRKTNASDKAIKLSEKLRFLRCIIPHVDSEASQLPEKHKRFLKWLRQQQISAAVSLNTSRRQPKPKRSASHLQNCISLWEKDHAPGKTPRLCTWLPSHCSELYKGFRVIKGQSDLPGQNFAALSKQLHLRARGSGHEQGEQESGNGDDANGLNGEQSLQESGESQMKRNLQAIEICQADRYLLVIQSHVTYLLQASQISASWS